MMLMVVKLMGMVMMLLYVVDDVHSGGGDNDGKVGDVMMTFVHGGVRWLL